MPMDNKNANMEEKLRILEDLNMMYIRQIALSLQDSDIQKKMDHELRMREGACKLLLCCSQRDQALEAAKSLQTCSARILAYMSELQRMKEKQVLGRAARRSSESGPMDDRQPCSGKVAISDLRIPLMWKDTEYFKNKGELHRCAVFCLLQIGGEIFDTDMVMVDRTLTDICFDNTIVFSEAGPGFELRVELYSCCSEEEGGAAGGGTPRKLASRLSSSLGRSAGKRLRGAMEPPGAGGGATLMLPAPAVPGPKYHLLAHTTLTLSHIQDSFRTHDLTISGHEECSYWLPLYGSVCCRLAAQPHCMTKQVMSGRLRVKQMGADSPGWTDVYGVLKGTNLFCYHRQEDVEANVEQAFTIAINKETRIRAWEKDAQSLCISNQYGGEDVTHTLAAADAREDTHRWMEAFWQHFYDMSQWKQCCDDLMKIELPSPRKPALVTPKQGSLYHEMVIEASDDLSTVSDILARRMQELELRSQLGATPSWMSLFDPESPGRPPRPRTPSLAPHSPLGSPRHRPPRSPLSPLRGPPLPRPGLLSSDASLTSDSDSPCSASPASSSSRHRRQAPPLSLPPPRHRPRTLSLDAKLSTLRGGRGYGGGALQTQCSCHQPPPSSSSSSSLLAPPAPPAPRAPPPPALSSCSSSTSSTSSSEGSHSPGSSEGGAPPFPPRPSPARRSLRNLRARLDPRNWLQSQV